MLAIAALLTAGPGRAGAASAPPAVPLPAELPLRSLEPASVAGGWGVMEGGEPLPLGVFLGRAGPAFAAVPEAAAAADGATLCRRLGFALSAAGLGILVGDAMLATDWGDRPSDHLDVLVPVGIGGLVVGAGGLLLMAAAHGSLASAVRIYNEESQRRAMVGRGRLERPAS